MKYILTFMVALFMAVPYTHAGSKQTKVATIYKTPGCGCCDGHADYLRKHGFKVTVTASDTLAEINKKAGIPEDFQGCHTAFIDGYAISGHVPMSAINKLLTERPDVKAIALPGMPMGSPGMNGEKDEVWKIYSFDKRGKTAVYFQE